MMVDGQLVPDSFNCQKCPAYAPNKKKCYAKAYFSGKSGKGMLPSPKKCPIVSGELEKWLALKSKRRMADAKRRWKRK